MSEAFTDPGTEVRQLLSKMEQLEQRFETRLLSDAHKEKLIDQLHAELQGYRNQLIRNQVRPALLDLIQIFDSYQKLIHDLPTENTPESAQILRNALTMVPQDILDLLYRQGVEPFETPDAVFQPQSQRVIQKHTTEDITMHRQIAQRLRPGFVWDGELIRQEWVNLYIHPNPDSAANKPVASNALNSDSGVTKAVNPASLSQEADELGQSPSIESISTSKEAVSDIAPQTSPELYGTETQQSETHHSEGTTV